jgi:hypothetical protein
MSGPEQPELFAEPGEPIPETFDRPIVLGNRLPWAR